MHPKPKKPQAPITQKKAWPLQRRRVVYVMKLTNRRGLKDEILIQEPEKVKKRTASGLWKSCRTK
jgi:hypothetical protein